MIASFEVILFKNLVVAAELKFSVLFYYFFSRVLVRRVICLVRVLVRGEHLISLVLDDARVHLVFMWNGEITPVI